MLRQVGFRLIKIKIDRARSDEGRAMNMEGAPREWMA